MPVKPTIRPEMAKLLAGVSDRPSSVVNQYRQFFDSRGVDWQNDPLVIAAGKPGLGDRIAAVLRSIGITAARVERVTGKRCGCKTRQEKLNRFGKWIADRFRAKTTAQNQP